MATFALIFMQPMIKQFVNKGIVSFLIVLVSTTLLRAQQAINWPTPETKQMYEQARTFLSNGNVRQAIPLFQQLTTLTPDQMVVFRDLGNAYYLAGSYDQADKTLNTLIESGRADEQCYYIAASSKQSQKDEKKAKKILSKGIDKYPGSGLLYHQYGKIYDDVNDEANALSKWVSGIHADPLFRINYYDAARTYYLTSKPVWAIIYGEIFINLEQLTPRSYETRKMVMAAYRKFFTLAAANAAEFNKAKNNQPDNFEDAVTQTLMKLAPVVNDGITTENLVMLRTRFMMDWHLNYAAKYPFTSFTFQDDLLRAGKFDAYNQWLFGKAENTAQFEGWMKYHPDAIPGLQKWMETHVLRPTAADNYNSGRMKGLFPQNPYKR